MARNSGKLFDDLVRLPWWASVVIAVIVYIVLANAPSLIQPQNIMLKGVVAGLPQLAPLFGALFLAAAAFSAFRQWWGQRTLEKQTGMNSIRELDWRRFELLIAEGFRREGYTIVDTPQGADGGVDIVLFKGGKRILVQCKHWKSRQVGVRVVREMLGVVTASGAQSGIIAISGTFTKDAEEFAEKNRIRLIDGQELVGLLNLRGTTKKPPTQPAFVVPVPVCPRCNKPMVLRTAKEGQFAGQKFWGCSKYPACRGTAKA